MPAYDDKNIFARILRGEIPSQKVLETEHSFAFRDIAPKAPVHVLLIPKGAYVSYDDFAANASDAEILDFTRALARLTQELGVDLGQGQGFRAITNAGPDGVQEVPHFHLHILGGRHMGRMVDPA
ncbi:MAG TPA: HIT domain-containing protein [Paracoccus sp. (in: a-proteobacteria)]|uniref:HIT domain-containing protein n=1 Tax=Paracoccus sp. TaxID=267 RepID=UPI002D0A56EA|nr:HIT domain-containing protein [Paracoccus sp. (in: a-proteobacteria)]HWL56045.1 HIT domain-containing protein [Paracoccus sp. (in: a-proteobacteria)]